MQPLKPESPVAERDYLREEESKHELLRKEKGAVAPAEEEEEGPASSRKQQRKKKKTNRAMESENAHPEERGSQNKLQAFF